MDCHHIAGAENYFTPVLSSADPDSTWVDESWRRLSETNFDEVKGKDCVFVADWLKTKGLHKLCIYFYNI